VATSALVLDVLNFTIRNFYLYCHRQIFIGGVTNLWLTSYAKAASVSGLYLRWG